MLNAIWKWHSNPSYDFVLKLVASLILVCTLGPITIKVRGELPITMQTFALLLVAVLFGWRIGGLTSFLYVLFGLAGLPVFAGYVGGIEFMTGQFGGFFFGFVAGSLVAGFLAELPNAFKPLPNFGIWVLGHVIVVALGAIWLRSLNPDGWLEMVKFVLPGAMIKSALGFLLTQVILRLFKGRKAFY